MARNGGPRGKPQRGNSPSYVMGSGLVYRPGLSLPPAEAEKIVLAAQATQCTVSGLLTQMVSRMEVDEHGVPSWFERPEEQHRLIA